MTCAPPQDLDALAKRYLELWQEQLAALASQPDAASWASRMAGLMQPFNTFTKPFSPEAVYASATAPAGHSSAAGAAATATALEHLSEQLAQLGARIGALEQQLAARTKPASAKPRTTTKSATRKPARPRTRTSKRK